MKHEAYWNLHKNMLSLRPCGGRVQHVEFARFEDVTFSVQPAGRARVLREQKKNVHAFVRGYLRDWGDRATDPYLTVPPFNTGLGAAYKEVTYNPYLYETFVRKHDESPIHRAESAVLFGRRIFAREEK